VGAGSGQDGGFKNERGNIRPSYRPFRSQKGLKLKEIYSMWGLLNITGL